jgi:hypothetical protein
VDLDVRIVGPVFARIVRLDSVFFAVPGHEGLPGARAGAASRVNKRSGIVIDDGVAMPTSCEGWCGQARQGVRSILSGR